MPLTSRINGKYEIKIQICCKLSKTIFLEIQGDLNLKHNENVTILINGFSVREPTAIVVCLLQNVQ
jgi:hypothetical protein